MRNEFLDKHPILNSLFETYNRRANTNIKDYKFVDIQHNDDRQYDIIIGERLTRKVLFEKIGYPEYNYRFWPFQEECKYIEHNLVFKKTRRPQSDGRQVLFEKTFNPSLEKVASILDFF